MTARVNYVESVDSVVCGKHAVSNFGAIFENLSVYRSTFMLTGKSFCMKNLYHHRKLLLYHSKEESLWPSTREVFSID